MCSIRSTGRCSSAAGATDRVENNLFVDCDPAVRADDAADSTRVRYGATW